MSTEQQIRAKLEARRSELQNAMSRLGQNAREAGTDVQDEIDQVMTSETKTTALELSSRDYESLRDVEAALARLADGRYGRCVICGKAIEPARLAAIPETPYCLEHADTALAAAAELA